MNSSQARRPAPWHRCQGQSVVEFLVLAMVLVPLFLTLPLLGKYLDLAHTTEQAARYAAFETTVSGPAVPTRTDAMLAAELRQRFFSTSAAPIRTGSSASDTPAHRNPLWSDHRGQPLIDRFAEQIGVRLERRNNAAPASAPLAGAAGFELPTETEYTARVSVTPRDIAGLPGFDSLGLQISRHQVVLSGPWSARNADEVARRIEQGGALLHPIAPLKLIGDTVGTVLPQLMLDDTIDVGTVRADIVPCDRLLEGC
ncbi:hypothetical protein [Thauera sp. WH-1]|uniref:hypothetical protein n=1 Tax=Thauera sp. WH-1 TaxID=3398230 RepID=UPI0039FD182C